MLRTWRAGLFATLTGALALSVGVGPAWSAAPANDSFAGATPISLPYTSGPVDTTQATTGPDDAAVGTACGLSGGGGGSTYTNSVWYSFTPTTDTVARIDATTSDYTVAGAVVTGSPSSFSGVACFYGSSAFLVRAGTTYYVDLLAYNAAGGNLQFSITTQPPQTTLTVTGGTFSARSGNATVNGTASCSPGDFAGVQGSLSQSIGRIATIRGYFSLPFACDGETHPWSATVEPASGKFAGGKATLEYSWVVGCYDFGCVYANDTKTIVLKK